MAKQQQPIDNGKERFEAGAKSGQMRQTAKVAGVELEQAVALADLLHASRDPAMTAIDAPIQAQPRGALDLADERDGRESHAEAGASPVAQLALTEQLSDAGYAISAGQAAAADAGAAGAELALSGAQIAGIAAGVVVVGAAAAGGGGGSSGGDATPAPTPTPTPTPPATPSSAATMSVSSGKNASGTTTNDDTPTFSGTGGTAGNTVNFYVDGQLRGTTTVAADGTFSFTPTALSEGAHTVTYTFTNSDGTSGQSPSASVTVDTTAPTATVTIASFNDNAGTITNASAASGTVTDDLTPTIQGTLSTALAVGDVLHVLRNGTVVGAATVSGTNWSFADTGLVDATTYTYSTRLADALGNQGAATGSFSLSTDTTAPTATATIASFDDDVGPITNASAPSGTVTDDLAPTIQGTLSTALGTGETLRVLRNGTDVGAATVSGTNWSYDDTGLADATTYTYSTRLVDAAGNQAAAAGSFSLSTLAAAPTQTVAISNFADNTGAVQGNYTAGAQTDDGSPTFNGTLSSALRTGDQLILTRDSTEIDITSSVSGTNWSYTDNASLADGYHVYTAFVRNSATGADGAFADTNVLMDAGATEGMTGGTGADVINGNQATANVLVGGAGNDFIAGGGTPSDLVSDALTGGAGDDKFAFSMANSATVNKADITDFTRQVGNNDSVVLLGMTGSTEAELLAQGFGMTIDPLAPEHVVLNLFRDSVHVQSASIYGEVGEFTTLTLDQMLSSGLLQTQALI